jgi:hypothetical protein
MLNFCPNWSNVTRAFPLRADTLVGGNKGSDPGPQPMTNTLVGDATDLSGKAIGGNDALTHE